MKPARPLLPAVAALLVLAATPPDALAAPPPEQPARPRIGLVLGGGGAMGAAHIGVLKVLEQLHVPVDCIAGTSVGALVGGAYASGMTAEQIDRFVTGINWPAVFSLEQVRRYQPMRIKRDNETVSNKLEFGLRRDGLVAPRALIETQQVESLIREMVAPEANVTDFDKLPIPFRAVATDLKTGQMVVFRSGELPVVMRASMSVPGAFAPVELGDKLLVDGGITDNLPVDVARQTCADVVIAVAVDAKPPSTAEMRSAAGSVRRMLDILIHGNEKASLASLGPRDVGIDITLDGVGSTDFQLAAEAIAQGEAAARKAAPRLARLSLSPQEYASWRARVIAERPPVPTVIAGVRFDGVDRDTASYLRSLVTTRAGQPVDEKRIADDALRIYATGAYESVAHRVESHDGSAEVVFQPVLKSWGPTFVTFDYGFEAGLSGTPQLLVSSLLRRTWPDSNGNEWRTLAQLGTMTKVETDMRLPFGRTRRTFLLPRLGWYDSREDLYSGSRRVATYAFRSLQGQLRTGLEMGTWGELQTGVYWRRNDTVREIGDPVLASERGYHDAGYLLEFERDTRDSDFWATRGSRQRVELTAATPALGAAHAYRAALVELNKSALLSSNALVFLDLAGGTAFGDQLPVQQQFRLGGPGAMTGLERGQLRGSEFAYGRLGMGWRITNVSALLDMDLYAGAALEAGNVWDRLDGSPPGGLKLGPQLFLGGNTPFGPVQLTGGYVSGGDFAVFLAIGRPVRDRWR